MKFIFQLYEESQQANTRLKDDLEKLSNENAVSKKKLEDAMKVFLHIIKMSMLYLKYKMIEFLLVLLYKKMLNIFSGGKFRWVDRDGKERKEGTREKTLRNGRGTKGKLNL